MKKKDKKKKINFFNKMYIALFKIKKYTELEKEGVKSAFKYVIGVLLILGIIYSGILTYQMKLNGDNLKAYLSENLPELKYEEKTLKVDAEEKIILDDNLVKTNFGGQIVIDTITNYDELVEEYKNKKEATILLTLEKFTTINSEGTVRENSYDEVIEAYLGQEPNNLDKDTLLYLFDNISYSYYFIAYVIAYIMAHLIIVIAFGFIISFIMYFICKIRKLDMKFLKICKLAMYSLTIAMMIFFVANFVTTTIKIYMEVVAIFISAVYLWIAIKNNKDLIIDGKVK